MQYKQFGNTGMQVSRYCLGTMTFPNRLDLDESRRIVDEAIDRGVNFIDTADSYGKSEEVLGNILDRQKRERVYLATKVYSRFCRDQRAGRNSRVNIISSVERSLRILQTDYVDLYQLHHPDPNTPIEETMATLDDLVRQGNIRYVGVSKHYAWQMAVMLRSSFSAATRANTSKICTTWRTGCWAKTPSIASTNYPRSECTPRFAINQLTRGPFWRNSGRNAASGCPARDKGASREGFRGMKSGMPGLVVGPIRDKMPFDNRE